MYGQRSQTVCYSCCVGLHSVFTQRNANKRILVCGPPRGFIISVTHRHQKMSVKKWPSLRLSYWVCLCVCLCVCVCGWVHVSVCVTKREVVYVTSVVTNDCTYALNVCLCTGKEQMRLKFLFRNEYVCTSMCMHI